MPATHPDRTPPQASLRSQVEQDACPSNSKAPSDVDRQDGNLEITINFLGCPSSSTRISYQLSEACGDSQPGEDNGDSDGALQTYHESNTGVGSNGVTLKHERGKAMADVCQLSQGQNNNRCSDTAQMGEATGVNDHSVEHDNSTRVEESHSDGEDEEGDVNNLSATTNPDDTDRSLELVSGAATVSLSRDVNSESVGLPASELASSMQSLRKKKSTGSLEGCGRALLSRMHRSPQRHSSPFRKKGGSSKGSSAPMPRMPTPVQNSTGFTNISRPSSVSSTRRNELNRSAKISDSLRRPDAYGKSSPAVLPQDASGSDEPIPEFLHSIFAKCFSPSLDAPNQRRLKNVDPSPTHSLAASDLHRHSSAAPYSQPAASDPDAQQMPCQFIFPEEGAWSPRAPHGDIKQNSPQKMLEKSHLIDDRQHVGREQQLKHQEESYQRKKSIHRHAQESPDFASGFYTSDKSRPSGAALNIADIKIQDDTSSAAFSVGGRSNVSTSTVTQLPTSAASTLKSRSSRRHPVLDKMFRHVLASLVQESGPPNSARLASVLEQAGGRGAEGGSSESQVADVQHLEPASLHSTSTTVASASNATSAGSSRFSSSYSVDRFLLFGSGGSARVPCGTSSALPCTLSKIDEKVNVNCPRPVGHGEATVAMADAQCYGTRPIKNI